MEWMPWIPLAPQRLIPSPCNEWLIGSYQEHDGRLAPLCKNPLLLHQMLESQKWSDRFRATKAAMKNIENW